MNINNKKLYRIERNGEIGGVCAGLAEYFNVDVTLIRIIFVLLGIFGGNGVLLYVILWMVMPEEQNVDFGDNGKMKRKNDDYIA
ncbi:MAG: PspC domain-containing protein [Chloroflexota bacterium]